MSFPHRVFLLIALIILVVLAGCAARPPLPAKGPPSDFLFIFTQDRPESGIPAGEEQPNSASVSSPKRVRVSVDAAGQMEVEATHLVPHLIVERSSLMLRSEQVSSLYEAIRRSDFYPLQDKWEGDDEQIGLETYFVLGNGQSKTVTVVGTAVPALAGIRSTVLGYLPSLQPTTNDEHLRVVMDTRTNMFHNSGNPHVVSIPLEFQKHYPHQWAALDDGGHPCSSFEDSGKK